MVGTWRRCAAGKRVLHTIVFGGSFELGVTRQFVESSATAVVAMSQALWRDTA